MSIKKIFISYSHDNETHKVAVLSLATKLMEWGGLDVTLDQWETSPEEGWTLWMEKSIRDADYSLIISTSMYYDKVLHDKQEGGNGVKWEGRIIRNLLYHSGSVSKKFVPILLGNAKPVHILTALRDATHYRADTKEGFEQLYRYLTAQPEVLRPKVKPAVKPLSSKKPSVQPPQPMEVNPAIPKTEDNPKSLVAQGQLRKALVLMASGATDEDDKNSIIMFQSQLSSLERQESIGTISSEQARITRNRITHAILSMI